MKTTKYTNPHGLSDKANHSCAVELAFLSSYAMKNPVFRKIVNTKKHECPSYLTLNRFTKLHPDLDPPDLVEKAPFETGGLSHIEYPMTWHNSNRLLTVPGFSGIKTGITPTAGSCLSIYFETADCKLITVVLGSRNIEYRWKDTRRLTLWAASVIKQNKQTLNSTHQQPSPIKRPMPW